MKSLIAMTTYMLPGIVKEGIDGNPMYNSGLSAEAANSLGYFRCSIQGGIPDSCCTGWKGVSEDTAFRLYAYREYWQHLHRRDY
jgi:hypothetical protein